MKEYIMVEWPNTQGSENTESTFRFTGKQDNLSDKDAKLYCFGLDVPEMVVHRLGGNFSTSKKLANNIVKRSQARPAHDLLHESTIKQMDGVIEITVFIVKENKRARYTYKMNSEFFARKFHDLYRKGRKCHGKALTVLNKNQIKED